MGESVDGKNQIPKSRPTSIFVIEPEENGSSYFTARIRTSFDNGTEMAASTIGIVQRPGP
jgi:hypothetical protein